MSRRVGLMLLVTLLGITGSGSAREHERHVERPGATGFDARGRNLSLDEAVNSVRRETRGRVLSAEQRGSEYRIRIITDNGKVRRLRIDPETGRRIR